MVKLDVSLRDWLKQASALQRNYLESASLLAVLEQVGHVCNVTFFIVLEESCHLRQSTGSFLKMSRCDRHDNPF